MQTSDRIEPTASPAWAAAACCTLLGSLAAARLASSHGRSGIPLAAALVALALLLFPYFLLGIPAAAARFGSWMRAVPSRALAVVAALLLPYLVYSAGTDTLSLVATLKLVGFVLLPAALLIRASRSGSTPGIWDALAVLALWLPLELSWARAVWVWPEGGAYALSGLLGVDLVLVLFVAFRGLDGVGYRLVPRRADLPPAFWNLLIFLGIGIPIGIATGFIAYNHRTPDPLHLAASWLGIFLLTAVPEELLFRGLIQNLLQRALPATTALVLAALIFGAAHLDNGPHPDWRYFLLASIAGIFYGRAYRQCGGLMSACLVHASVDAIWRELFE